MMLKGPLLTNTTQRKKRTCEECVRGLHRKLKYKTYFLVHRFLVEQLCYYYYYYYATIF